MPSVFTRTTNRDTLMPPPVLPAQAPINISKTSTVLLAWDHRLKSTVEKPVVVIMEATWKETWVSVSKTLPYRLNVSMETMAMAAAMMPM